MNSDFPTISSSNNLTNGSFPTNNITFDGNVRSTIQSIFSNTTCYELMKNSSKVSYYRKDSKISFSFQFIPFEISQLISLSFIHKMVYLSIVMLTLHFIFSFSDFLSYFLFSIYNSIILLIFH